MTTDEEVQYYIDKLQAIMQLDSDDEVARQSQGLLRDELRLSTDSKIKARVLTSKELTDIIVRIEWILTSKEESDRVFGKPPCAACKPEQECLHCQDQKRIAQKVRDNNGRTV